MMVERSRESLAAAMAAVLLVGAGVLLQFYHLSRPNFYQDVPARDGAYVQQMNMDGTWLAPSVDGRAQFDVSPMHLWSIKAASRLRPEVEFFHVRAPGALCALLLAILVGWWFYQHAVRYGREDMAEVPPEGFALLAALVTASSPFLIMAGRSGTPVAMFTLVWLAAAFCWGESLEARRSFYAGRPWRVWVIWGYLLAGLGMLVYGPAMLVLLWVPYVLAARAYHLNRPTLIHLPGLVLALLIGASAPAAACLEWPDRAAEVWRAWATLPLTGQPPVSLATKAGLFTLAHLPWLLLALIMCVRVWLRKDRSPTLVFWMNSLVGLAVVLGVAGPWSGGVLLPLVPIVALLAADALYRWNFEHGSAILLRALMRVTIVVGILGGIFLAVLTESHLGQALLGLLAISWLVWTIRVRRHGIIYTQWQTTARLATIILLMIVACEAAVLSDWVPREYLFHSTIGYFARVHERMKNVDAPAVYLGRRIPGLYAYYLRNKTLRPVADLNQVTRMPGGRQILFTRGNFEALAGKPGFVQLTTNPRGADALRPYDAMYLVLPAGVDSTTLPLRIALVGNSGTRRSAVRDVARKLGEENDAAPLDHVLMLGNNIWGPRLTDHLDFTSSFERPFRNLLRKGVLFHAVLGHEDQSYGWIQSHYPPFRMEGRRYYSVPMRGGLVECFMLDTESMSAGKARADEQIAWLDKALAASRARWKIVGMHEALLTAAGKGKASPQLAARLIPLFERHGVSLVAWGNNPWYERLRQKPAGPVYINDGWSGSAETTSFAQSPLLQAANCEHGGFVLLDVTDRAMRLRAVNRKGDLIDRLEIPAPAAPPRP